MVGPIARRRGRRVARGARGAGQEAEQGGGGEAALALVIGLGADGAEGLDGVRQGGGGAEHGESAEGVAVATGDFGEVAAVDDVEQVSEGTSELRGEGARVGRGERFVELIEGGGRRMGRCACVRRRVGVIEGAGGVELGIEGFVEEFVGEVIEVVEVVDVRFAGHGDIVGRCGQNARGNAQRGAKMRAPVGVRRGGPQTRARRRSIAWLIQLPRIDSEEP
ncbi:MAG: hypothetical protein ACF8R7_07295 [Phycisphaerales bacterium JB039]